MQARESDGFFRTATYRDLRSQIDASLGSDRFTTNDGRRERARLAAELAEARWAFEHPGCTGRFRVGLKNADGSVTPIGLEFDCTGRTRFETRGEAWDWIATQTDIAPEKLGVVDVEALAVTIARAA